VGQAGESVSGIYEADYRNFNRETYTRGREVFDRTYAEFKELLIGCWWRDSQLSENGNLSEESEDGQTQTA
jgi:chromosome partitioning protein